MPRPSQRIDLVLLKSGRELFAGAGCVGLSLRAVAEHAGANVGMFHYHFGSKAAFLEALLQQMYEEMFDGLSSQAAHEGPALERLRGALIAIGRFLHANRQVVARLWMDAVGGEPVARAFMQRNAPRHLGVLLRLMDEAEREGALRALPAVQRFALLMGAVVMPIIFIAGMADLGVDPKAFSRRFKREVLTDAALAERVDLALGALRAPPRRGTARKERKP